MEDKNIKIKVQSKIPLGVSVALSIVILIAASGPFLLMYFTDQLRFNLDGFECLLISSSCVVAIVVGYILPLFKECAYNTKYVADIIITPYSLQIIYKLKSKIEEVKEVSLQDIKSVKMGLYAEVAAEIESTKTPTKGRIVHYCTETVIILKNNEVISFKTSPLNTSHTVNIYKYLTNVLKVKHIFPDFSYELKISESIPNKQDIEDYINYFAEHGRKPPFYKDKHRMMLILHIIVYTIIFIFLGCALWYVWRHFGLWLK